MRQRLFCTRKQSQIASLVEQVKEQEAKGYAYDSADASFELLVKKTLGTIPNYFTLISCCIKDISFSELDPEKIEKKFYSLESIFKYKNANEEFQNIAYKLGIHTTILLDIKRYSSLRKKEKK